MLTSFVICLPGCSLLVKQLAYYRVPLQTAMPQLPALEKCVLAYSTFKLKHDTCLARQQPVCCKPWTTQPTQTSFFTNTSAFPTAACLLPFTQSIRSARPQSPTFTVTYVHNYLRTPFPTAACLLPFTQSIRSARPQLPTFTVTYVHNYLRTPFPTAACLLPFTQSIRSARPQ